MKFRVGPFLFLFLAFVAAGPPAWPQVPAGGEFQVTTFDRYLTVRGSVTAAANGSFLVVWSGWLDIFPAGDGRERVPASIGTAGRLYDATGGLIAAFQVRPEQNSSTPGAAFGPGSTFLVAWQQWDGSDYNILARRYDGTGAPLGGEFVVNAYTTGRQWAPLVTWDAAGSFVVAWTSRGQDGSGYGVFGRRYDAAGTPRGAEFQLNSYTSGNQSAGALASVPGGGFIAVWTSSDGGGDGVFARRFDPSGAPLGTEFQVNTYTTGYQSVPSAAADSSGRFLAAWTSSGQDGYGDGVFAQRFDASGNRLGAEFRVNTATFRDQRNPSVACDQVGDCTIAWASDASSWATYIQRYDTTGAPRGTEYRVLGDTFDISVASDPAGNLVSIARRGVGPVETVLIGQRVGGIVPATGAVDTAASGGSDGNGVLEPGESVDVRPSWRNVNGVAQTFDGTALGFTGPAGSGVSYQLLDAAGTYGSVPNGATAECSDCYRVAVGYGGTRPSVHWDATFTERLTPDVLGQTFPWPLHVGQSFADVPKASLFYRDVETLLHRGVTAGCSASTYCPASPVTREQMAAFVLLAKEGKGYVAAPCSPPNLFGDVPETSLFCDVIEELARRGVVSGCGGGNYCPGAAVAREQMPVFVLRLLDPALDPPACTTPRFADVPASSPYCRWIEELARRGVVGGCGGGNYCPTAPVTREQMATFLTGTYGLTLYGP